MEGICDSIDWSVRCSYLGKARKRMNNGQMSVARYQKKCQRCHCDGNTWGAARLFARFDSLPIAQRHLFRMSRSTSTAPAQPRSARCAPRHRPFD